MDDALFIHRLHFAFTITFHYLFPQLTMGLAPLIVVLKTIAIRTQRRALQPGRPILGQDLRHQLRRSAWSPASRWNFSSARTGRNFRKLTGGVIGQPLAMEGVFSFFLESAFLGLFLFGEKRLEPVGALGCGVHGLPGLVAFGIFHHRDRRVDAASRRRSRARPTARSR